MVFAEIVSWNSWRNESAPDASFRVVTLGIAFTLLFLGGGITLVLLALCNIRFVVGVFVVAYATDTAALATGKLLKSNPVIGKTKRPLLKFAPSKTLAGFIGALFGGLTVTFALCGLGLLPAKPLAALAPAIVIAADLLGSGFKRTFGIKDSGQILAEYRQNYKGNETFFSHFWRGMLPHGGFLDRFGSVFLLAAGIYLLIL
jgi:CDP-diglyceride synthetase